MPRPFHLQYYQTDDSEYEYSYHKQHAVRKHVKLVSFLLILLGGSFLSYMLWSYVLLTYNATKAEQITNPTYLVEATNINAAAQEPDPRKVVAEASEVEEPARSSGYAYFTLSVPRINLTNALVTTNVSSSKEDVYFPVLEKSIAHYQGSALPGEKGNVFLYGHSVLPQFFNQGDYLTIFSHIYKLEKDDKIYTKYGNDVIMYKVTGRRIVDPKDIQSANIASRFSETLTLMTCYPPGLTTQRLLIYADKVVE